MHTVHISVVVVVIIIIVIIPCCKLVQLPSVWQNLNYHVIRILIGTGLVTRTYNLVLDFKCSFEQFLRSVNGSTVLVKETKRISHAQGDVEGKFVAHLMLEVLS
jgi:hypothetical protein